MDHNGWGLSESSDSDTDDDRPFSTLSTNTQFYQMFQNGEYGADWPKDLQLQHQHAQSNQLNHSDESETNENESSHFVRNQSADLNESRTILSPRTILENPAENIVFISDGGRLQAVRVIPKEEIHLLPIRQSPVKAKPIKAEVKEQEEHHPKDIPLEKIDFIDEPKDPRRTKRNYCPFNYDHELKFPKFWRETICQSEQARNRERNFQQNGSFKRSNSYVRERALQRSERAMQRIGAGPRRDPRLEKTLFSPPRRILSPQKSANTSRTQKSIFENNDESTDTSSLTPPSDSYGSTSSAANDAFNGFGSSKADNADVDSASSDGDYSFNAFTNKRKTRSSAKQQPKKSKYVESSSTKEKVPPIRINIKKNQVTTESKEPQDNILFGKLPTVDKDAILQALTVETSEEQENVIPKVNKKETKKVDHKIKKEPKKIKISPASNNRNVSMTDAGVSENSPDKMVHEKPAKKRARKSVASEPIHDNVNNVDKIDKLNWPSAEADGICVTRTLSNASSGSIGSIEKRLAEMTSPVKSATVPNDEIQMIEENLATMLSVERDTVEPMEVTDILNSEVVDIHPSNDTDINHESYTSPLTSPTTSENVATSPECRNITRTENDPFEIDTSNSIPQATTDEEQATTSEEEKKTNDDPSTNEKLVDTEDVMPNLLLAVPEIGANAEVFGIAENINLDEYTKDLDTSSLDTFDINLSTFNQALEAFKDGAKNKIKTQRARIIINDFSENESVIGTATATMTMANDLVTSDDDYEDDIPCGMDDLILPNSNTDRNAVNRLEPNCRLCSYQVTKGYKQLTKHYVRKHPKKEIPISRLAQAYNPQELMINPITPLITNGLTETLIQSICFICDESYNMSSSKWVMHFITHTGEFEFRCNKCHSEILQDLHKKCNSKNNERINGPFDFIDNALYGYVCALCKYIQLSKSNVEIHLDEQHQQLVTSDENIHEIILLKMSQADFLVDSKLNKSLMEAKLRNSTMIPSSDRFMNVDIPISDDDDEQPDIPSIDLTLSDDDSQ